MPAGPSNPASSPSSSSSSIGAALGLPPRDTGLKSALVELFGKGGADIGHIADLFLSLVESLARRESGYKTTVDEIRAAFAKVRRIIEAYHPQLAIVETIEAIRTQIAEREKATAMLKETVESVKARIRGQADALLAMETST